MTFLPLFLKWDKIFGELSEAWNVEGKSRNIFQLHSISTTGNNNCCTPLNLQFLF